MYTNTNTYKNTNENVLAVTSSRPRCTLLNTRLLHYTNTNTNTNINTNANTNINTNTNANTNTNTNTNTNR